MGTQQLCLKWNKHYSNLLDISERLLSTEALVDVTLACEGLCLKAHKLVLSACSPFFQAIFTENPCKHPVVIMKGVSYADLKAIVEFMYRGEVSVTRDQLSALLETAQMLQVRGLAEDNDEENQNPEPVNSQSSGTVLSNVQLAPSNKHADFSPHKRKKKRRRRMSSGSDGNYSDSENQSVLKVEEPASPEVVNVDDKDKVIEQESAASPMQHASTSSYSTSNQSSRITQITSHDHQPSVSVPTESSLHPEASTQPSSPANEPDIKVEPVEVLEQDMDVGNSQDVSRSQTHTVESVLQQLPPSFTLTPVVSEQQTVPEPPQQKLQPESRTASDIQIRKVTSEAPHHSRNLSEPVQHVRGKGSEAHHSRTSESFRSRSVPESHPLRSMPEPDMSVLVPFSISSESSAGSLHDNTSQDVMVINNVPFEDASSSSLAGPSHQQDGTDSNMLYDDATVAVSMLPGPSNYQAEQSSRQQQGPSQGPKKIQEKQYHSLSCNICHKMLSSKANLEDHMMRHMSDPRTYSCNICNKEFHWRTNLSRHKRYAHKHFQKCWNSMKKRVYTGL